MDLNRNEVIEMLYSMMLKHERLTRNELREFHVLKNTVTPKKIYKYRMLNSHSIDNLRNDTMYFNTPSNFNDPFDTMFTMDSEKVNNTIDGYEDTREEINELVMKMSDKHPNIIDLKNDLRTEFQRKSLLEFSGENRESFKICCFSETFKSLLMWAHYADYHKGFCIEYDTDFSSGDIHKNSIFPVSYRDEMYDITQLVLDRENSASHVNIMSYWLSALIKSKDWAYEKEWRVIYPNNSAKEQLKNISSPTAVYLGARCSDNSYIEKIKDICREKQIPLYQMNLFHNKYELYEELIKEN